MKKLIMMLGIMMMMLSMSCNKVNVEVEKSYKVSFSYYSFDIHKSIDVKKDFMLESRLNKWLEKNFKKEIHYTNKENGEYTTQNMYFEFYYTDINDGEIINPSLIHIIYDGDYYTLDQYMSQEEIFLDFKIVENVYH